MPSERRPSRDPLVAETVGVVVPIRSFRLGKARLADALTEHDRVALAREMAATALDAARGLPIVVVSSDPDVTTWAQSRGVPVIDDHGSLDAAAADGRSWVAAAGLARVVVVHADLPLIRSLEPVVAAGGPSVAVVVPCHRNDGTPVLALPVAAPFRFAYGAGSFRRHCAEGRRIGLEVRVVDDPELRFDVDVADDLATLHSRATRPA